VYVDSEVQRHEIYEAGQEFNITYHAGGGTDMCAGIRYVEDQDIDASVVVVLTDGYTPFPQDETIPTVWCISSDKVSPSGETVHFEMEEA
jgi:predicted metal-dependent peptidase